jgi:flagellar hook-basal body complex protein FliE
MIIPAVGNLTSGLSESLAKGVSGQTTNGLAANGQSSAGLEGAGGLEPTNGASGVEGTTGVNGVEGTTGAGGVEGAGGLGGAGGNGSSSFGSELSEAISSLESTQQSANSAAQSLASGTAKDPESAVVTVEDAQMAMDLAAQLRTKAAEAAQSIFQTQV